MNDSQANVVYLSIEELTKQKQRLRDKDEAALKSGEKTAQEITSENSALALFKSTVHYV